MAVFTSSAGRLTKDYSDNKKQLAEAIDKVQAHERYAQLDAAACPNISPYDAYQIAILMDESAIHAKSTEMRVCTQGLPMAPPTPPTPGKVNRLSPGRADIIAQAQRMWDQVSINSQNNLAAISFALGELYRMPGPRIPGSRVLLLVSSGFLTGTLERDRDKVVDQAVRTGVVVNALDAKGLFAITPGRPFGEGQISAGTPIEVYVQETLNAVDSQDAPSKILADLAASTGGLYFHHNNGFSEAFRELGAAPETTYLLGFRPNESELDGKYHKLKVRLAVNSSTIQARPGYFANAPTPSDHETLERQVTGSDVLKDLTTAVEAQAGSKTSAGLTPLRVKLHVDLKGVEFPEQNGRHTQKLTFVFALLDKDNAVVSAREGEMDFALTDAKFATLMESGVNAILTLEAPSGIYRLRTVAMEGLHSKTASLSYAIKLP